MTYDFSKDAIAPHGGVLVDRFADAAVAAHVKAQATAGALPTLQLNLRELSDLEMIACGALSPLTGFMTRADYERVVSEGRLADGLPWTIPVTLSIRGSAQPPQTGDTVALRAPDGSIVGSLKVDDVFAYDKALEAKN